MVKYYRSISDDHRDWALRQQVFFIASAPLAGRHINLSPKGLPASTLSVFDGNHVAYIDATGSGIETVSHVHENGRATIMFCSFDKAPRIMRWFCRGRVVEYDTPEFEVLSKRMGKTGIDCARAIILLEVFKGWLTQLEYRGRERRLTRSSTNILRLRRASHQPAHRCRRIEARTSSIYARSPDTWTLCKSYERARIDGRVSSAGKCEQLGRMRWA